MPPTVQHHNTTNSTTSQHYNIIILQYHQQYNTTILQYHQQYNTTMPPTVQHHNTTNSTTSQHYNTTNSTTPQHYNTTNSTTPQHHNTTNSTNSQYYNTTISTTPQSMAQRMHSIQKVKSTMPREVYHLLTKLCIDIIQTSSRLTGKARESCHRKTLECFFNARTPVNHYLSVMHTGWEMYLIYVFMCTYGYYQDNIGISGFKMHEKICLMLYIIVHYQLCITRVKELLV